MEMMDRLIFVIGTPRSGSTMLERMLASHSQIYGRPEPHIVTPLAYLGYWDKVEKAPYDHILAAEAQKEFVNDLPSGEKDYYAACRAYLDVLYGKMLEASGGKRYFLDKTPAYGLVVDFLARVYPETHYIVLTRHPIAIFSSFANSFFDGDYAEAYRYNPILNRYVPVMAKFLREKPAPMIHVKYEEIVKNPEKELERMFNFLDLPMEKEAVEYGKHEHVKGGLGDPISVAQYSKPMTKSIAKWANELAAEPSKLAIVKDMVGKLDPGDLETWGYPLDTLWEPLEQLGEGIAPPKKPKLSMYRLQRKAIVRLRNAVKNSDFLKGMLGKLKLFCEVLLREQ
ncbi:MAG: sulfotransferase [Candidatus Glassbacteria bacterium]